MAEDNQKFPRVFGIDLIKEATCGKSGHGSFPTMSNMHLQDTGRKAGMLMNCLQLRKR